MQFEQECFQIILHGGNGRSIAFEAIRYAKQNNLAQAKESLAQARIEIQEASKVHAKLLQRFVTDETCKVEMLLVHAEDHMSSSQVILEMATELIDIYERMGV